MAKYVLVSDGDPSAAMELPVDEDGSILLSTISAQYPRATGLKYKPADAKAFRGVKVVDGKIQIPEDVSISETVFIVVQPKTGGDSSSSWSSVGGGLKRKREDLSADSNDDEEEEDATRPQDLIVLGVGFETTTPLLQEFFTKFGPLETCQVKYDQTGQSRGFGFLKFKDLASQQAALSNAPHYISGRRCDIKIPQSKKAKKIFVGQLAESITEKQLHEHFSQFGEVSDVYIPLPRKNFAFVSFAKNGIAQSLYGQEQFIDGNRLTVNPAQEKEKKEAKKFSQNDYFGGGQNSFGGNMPRIPYSGGGYPQQLAPQPPAQGGYGYGFNNYPIGGYGQQQASPYGGTAASGYAGYGNNNYSASAVNGGGYNAYQARGSYGDAKGQYGWDRRNY